MKIFKYLFAFLLLSTSAFSQSSRQIQSGDVTGALGYTPLRSIGAMLGPNITCGTGLSCSLNTMSVSGAGSSGQIQFNNSGLLGGFTMTGDATINTSTGALTLSTANPTPGSFGSASQCVSITTNGKGLITAASQTTCSPASVALGAITGLGTGVATWLATPSSANLRAAVTDETGTGSLFFQGGNIGAATGASLNLGGGTLYGGLTNQYATAGNPATSGTVDANVANRIGVSSVALDTGAFASGVIWMQNRLQADFSSNLAISLNPNGGNVAIGKATAATALDVSGTVTATTFAGAGTSLSGTAASLTAGNATKLATARAIGIAGSTGLTATGVNFDGTAAINPALTGTLVVANGGTGDTGTAWTAYTGAAACQTGAGTFTTTASRAKTLGKTVWWQMDTTITAIGTCTGATFQFTMPSTAQSGAGGAGREVAVAGVNITCWTSASTATTNCRLEGGTALAVNMRFVVSGVYESQ